LRRLKILLRYDACCSRFMNIINDPSQNLSARITFIFIVVVVVLSVLGGRLYFLQVVKGSYYAERAENQRIRLIPVPAPRGAIFDRNSKILVDSRPTYSITISGEAFKSSDLSANAASYAQGLGLDTQFVSDRIKFLKEHQSTGSMSLKDNATIQDIAWVEAHNAEYPELQTEPRSQRYYPLGKILCHVLGYVGEISPKQLESDDYKDLRAGDIIGKAGLEQYYDKFLRGKDGYRKVIVDSRGRVQAEIENVPPQSGQDLVTTIDLDLQKTAEEQLATSATKRGIVISMDPNNGELLAMASAPSYDPNVFVSGSATPEGRKQIAAYYNDPQRPLLNRAIQGRYYPGSTWKIPESVAALRSGAIKVGDSHIVCGGGIQIGNRFTRDTSGNHGAPDLPTAITKSCDGYYYRLGLRMTVDGLIKMVEDFGYDKPSGIDLPNELTPRTPKYYKPIIEKRDGRWPDIETVFASIGQVTVEVTPIAQLHFIASVGVRGHMYIPHLLKEFRAIDAIGDEGDANYVPPRAGFTFPHPEPTLIEMKDDQWDYVLKGMWGVVNNGGTAHAIKMPNLEIAGKTGTAQNSSIGTGGAKDHAWFVSFAPAYKPEISVIAMIENSGFGASNAAPAAKAMYEEYLQLKTARGQN
jgi:penicillin-binding protein 2